MKEFFAKLWNPIFDLMLRFLGGRIHPEGYRFIFIFALLTALLFFLSSFLGWVGVIMTLWCCWFFRDPTRVTPQTPGLVISPADGIVSAIEETVPPPELELGLQKRLRVSIFMSIFNCHVNRMPVSGKIVQIEYREGRFLNAKLDKASDDNERNTLRILMDDGQDIIVTQIAGLIARRIVCFVEPEDSHKTGTRFGLIRFGSRLDVYLPENINALVGVGQTMIAGETILADLKRKGRARKMLTS